jgi:hypothetical protein
MDEVKCSVYFYPKTFGVSWLCTSNQASNFGIGMYIFVQVSVSLICRVPILFLYVLDELYTSELPRRVCGYIIGRSQVGKGLR